MFVINTDDAHQSGADPGEHRVYWLLPDKEGVLYIWHNAHQSGVDPREFVTSILCLLQRSDFVCSSLA